MTTSISLIEQAIKDYEEVYDKTDRVLRIICGGIFMYDGIFTIKDWSLSVKEDYTSVVVDNGFDESEIKFPSKYYMMEDEDIREDWRKVKEEERKKKEEEIRKFEEENKQREKEKRYKEYLKLKEEFGE